MSEKDIRVFVGKFLLGGFMVVDLDLAITHFFRSKGGRRPWGARALKTMMSIIFARYLKTGLNLIQENRSLTQGGKYSMSKKYTQIFRVCIVVCCSFVALANAACKLPIPDGGSQPTSPNLLGTVVKITAAAITLKTKGGQIRQVKPPKSGVYFSAFGGDEKLEKLRNGSAAKVWFVNCRESRRGLSVAAYLEVYSNDPLDRPPAEFWSRR